MNASLPSATRSAGPEYLRLSMFVLALLFAIQARAELLFVGVTSPTSPPAISNTYEAGTALTISSYSQVAPPGSLQWLHDEQPVPAATTLSLTIPALSASDAGNYRLRVTSGTTVSYSNTVVVNVLPTTTSVVDTNFASQLPAGFAASYIPAFADDGSFIVRSDSANPSSFVRLAADGSLVAGFNFPASAGTVLAGFPDGRLITSQAPYLLAADGSALPFTLPATFDATTPLTAAVVAPDGKFLLSQGTKIVRCLSDGTVDSSFTFTTTDDSATAYAVDPQGRAFVRVRRLAANPSNYPSSWTVIYRLTATGAADPSLAAQTSIMTYNTWFEVVPLADGRIFYWSAYHGYYEWKIFRSDGSLDSNWSGGLFTERGLTIDPQRAQIYFRPTSGALRRYTIGTTGLVEDTSFYIGNTSATSLPGFVVDPNGKLILFTNADSWDGHATQRLARLRTDVPRPILPTSFAIYASTNTPARGASVTLSATVSDSQPVTYEWVSLDGQPLPATTTSSTLTFANFTTAHLGRYQLRLHGNFGTVLSNVIDLQLDTSVLNRPYLANLSGRAVPGTGEDTIFAGFTTKVYAGARGVPLLLRGVGPGLKDLGVANYLPNPALNLRDLSGTIVGNNDNWGGNADHATIRTDFSTTGAFALADDSLDAALLKTSYNQQFTVQLSDQANASGVGLLEIYRVPAELIVGELTNLSFRARTGPGEAVAIAGFVIVDPQNFDRSARVLLRAVGPTLKDQGINHPLANPILTLYNSAGEVVARNDDWSLSPATNPTAAADIYAAATQVGAFTLPSDSHDAALLLDLPAGAYSMHASGGEGVVLLEIYLVR